MASNQPTSSKGGPLSFMDTLSSAVSYFKPETPPPSGDPQLIVVFSWYAARELHIAKYIAQHRAIYPSSPILLVRSEIKHNFFPPSMGPALAPGVPVLRAAAEAAAAEASPQVLVHVFSNGGAACAMKMFELLRKDGNGTVPRHVTILDSCPGYFHWGRAHRAIAMPLPALMSPVIHVILFGVWLWHRALGMQLSPDYYAAELNAKWLVDVAPRRTYLYGTDDDMVGWQDVEHHAAHAKELGFKVSPEKFEGGKHVANVRVDADRYWKAVEEAWEAR